GLPTHSFVRKPVPTVDALIQHVKTDPVVMSRYMRHFGMSEDEVIAFFKTLHRGTIREDGAYLIYNTPESGEIRARVLFYRKGTPVFMDKDDNYILRVSCGNPMVRGTDYRTAKPGEQIVMNTATDMRDLVAAQPPGIATTDLTATTIRPVLPEASAITIADVPPATPSFSAPQIILPAAVLIPFTAGVLVNPGSGHQPVPEPASMAVLALGFGSVIGLRRRKKSKA
ncbi:MAG TPA: PEP-CTERM sorting domain-containing protein, partial [Fimbriimonadaceae bacterium]|nr:PEP-CTERM sorting domain-containing protein [Fimbriimonadaceae bacterium]